MRLNNLKIRTKLIIIYVVCVLLPMIATNFFILSSINQNVRNEQINDMQDMCDRIANKISESINNVISVSDYLYMDEKLNDFLKKKYGSAIEYYDSFNKLMENNVIRYYYTAQSVYSVLICTDNPTITNGTYFVKKKDVKDTTWYQAYEKSGGKVMIYPYFEQGNNYSVYIERPRHISVIRPMNYFDGDHVLKLDIDYIGLVNNIMNENVDFDIYVRDDTRILFSTAEHENRTKDFMALTESKTKDLEYRKRMNVLGKEWEIYVTTDSYSLFVGLKDKTLLVLLLLVVNLILPTVVILLINVSFRDRISLTERYIKKAEQGEFEEIVCHEGGDEIGNLIRSYNMMAVKIKELIEVVFKKDKEQQQMKIARKQAELNALQSQINPHFMFNVMESIRMHSFLKREKETAVILGEFAVLMRRVIQWDKDFVTIEEEMSYVKTYLDIQKYRFGERLSYSLHVQEECGVRKIPKFAILTLVENACVHGIENSIPGGTITVMVSMDEQHVYLAVMDSGSGISPFDLKQLREKIEHASLEEIGSSKSIGILNTVVRLKMYYEGKVEFDINSTRGEGTEICVTLPLTYNENLQNN